MLFSRTKLKAFYSLFLENKEHYLSSFFFIEITFDLIILRSFQCKILTKKKQQQLRGVTWA